MGFKFIQLEIDSNVVLTWLIDHNVTYPPNMIPLICDLQESHGLRLGGSGASRVS